MARSLLLWVLWVLSGQLAPAWVILTPCGVWLWQSAGGLYPWLRRQPEWRAVNWLLGQAQRGLMVGYLGLALWTRWRSVGQSAVLDALEKRQYSWTLALGCVVCGRQAPWAEVVSQADRSYTATLGGHFTLRVSGDHPFRVRLLMLCLRLLEGPTPQRGSRRPRDGRTPFVTQAQLAAWFGLPQPDISRLERYWLEGDWANLLRLKTAEVVTGS